MGQGPGGHKFAKHVTIVQFYNFRCFHASSSKTLTMALLLAIRILYSGPFRGVMKIRIAVTLVVLGLL